ncbi:MAG: hypothetical protein A2091_02810 [Desulfuromonadales bacterium GWD2_61_12]|nr:MAG: hypothetical protein A2091_02810 [Desulfuromonadales bacterium GWD2_61_12]
MTAPKDQKIVIMASSAPPWGGGGIASAHYNLYNGLKRLGVDVTLVTFGEHGKYPKADGIVRFGSSPRLRWLLNLGLWFYLKAKGSRKTAYQLSDILSSMPGALKANWQLRQLNPDIVILPDHGAPGLFVGKRDRKIFLVAHHNPARFIGNPLVGDFCPIDAGNAVSLEQRALWKYDGVICPSEYMRESFNGTYAFAGAVTVIPNLVDDVTIAAIPVAELRNKLDLSESAPIVFIPSAGSRTKGSRYVYEIIRRLSAAYGRPLGFYLSGSIEDDLRIELQHAPAQARIFAPGHVSYDENIAFMKACSFGVSPTLIENFSMAILEANFCRLPMVVFDVGGNREIVTSGENGFLVPYLDVEALIASAARLFDAGRLAELRERTLRTVENKFHHHGILKSILLFLQN